MGRRSDHGRDELEALILKTASEVMAEGGYARFSAREVAKRIGYSVGTVMHIFGNVDRLVMAVNARTFGLWADWLEERLESAHGQERILILVRGYFDFASSNRNLWSAIYEHRVPEDAETAQVLTDERVRLTGVIARELTALLPGEVTVELTGSLIATVHGHCAFLLGGTFALMDVQNAVELASARVMETLRTSGATFDG